jgi:hypothetical protein
LLRAVNLDLDPETQRPSFVRVYNLHERSAAARHFILAKVRKMPSWPRSWASFSLV